MSEQPEALRLADDLESTTRGYPPVMMAAAELRRLHELNQELLEALEQCGLDDTRRSYEFESAARIALRAALAEPVQEPVAWRYQDARGTYRYRGYVQGFDKEYSRLNPVPLYTTPPASVSEAPQRKPLTEVEIQDCFYAARNAKLGASKDNSKHRLSVVEIARAIERAHGIGGQDE